MARTDNRIDAYIENAPAFAQPILRHLRKLVHRACPDVEETVKWGMPSFTYKGQILAGMAAFKAHATFGFWRSSEVTGTAKPESGMGQFGRLSCIADLPDDETLLEMARKAAALINSGTKKTPPPAKHPKPDLTMPDDFATALAANAVARESYDGFPPSARRDYLEWVIEAKRPRTRTKRIAQSVAQLAEGKRRHWKYEKC